MSEIQNNYAILEKIKAEIVELNKMKSTLVADINEQLLKAKKESDKIISQAMEEAESFKRKSDDIIQYAKDFDGKIRIEISKLRDEIETEKDTINKEKSVFSTEREKLEGAKKEFEEMVSSKDSFFKSYMAEMKERELLLNVREKEISDREDIVSKMKKEVSEIGASNNSASKEIVEKKKRMETRISMLLQAEKDVIERKIMNDQLYAEISLLRDKAIQDLSESKTLRSDALSKLKEVEDQKEMINHHFSRIEKDQKELEERRIALEERAELIRLKDIEIVEKIAILKQLRDKHAMV